MLYKKKLILRIIDNNPYLHWLVTSGTLEKEYEYTQSKNTPQWLLWAVIRLNKKSGVD